MMYDLTHLRHILSVAKHRNFSRAAEELHITQPALSRSIGAFEGRYGVRLFDRGPGGVVVTAVGSLVVAEAERLIVAARDLDHNLVLYGRGDAGRIAIGVGPLAASLILPRLSSTLLRERPRLQLHAKIDSAEALLTALLSDEIEMVLANSWRFTDNLDVTISPVGVIRLSVMARAGHPLTGRKNLTLASLRGFPVASAVLLPSAGIATDVGSFICDNFHILRETVLSSDCVWIASPDLAADDITARKLCELDVSDFNVAQSELCLVRRRGRSVSPAANAVAKIVQDLCAQ